MKRWRAMLSGGVLLCAIPASAQVSEENVAAANRGYTTEQGRSAAWYLAEHKRVGARIAALKPQRPGVIDAYVVVAGLDDDDVFGREAAEAARVLSRRYDAAGRTILISAGKGASDISAPNGTPGNLATVLAAVAARMNVKEDALILYTTSHGGPRIGLASKDGKNGYGMIAPMRLADLVNELGIERRMVLISACYSGQFVAPLATPNSVIITAADDNRTSFGCAPSNDWTFFGDALINTALRKPQSTEAAIAEAFSLIGGWEFSKGLTSSLPRSFIGDQAKTWLAALEKRMPIAATPKVGRSAIEPELTVKPQ